MSRDRPVALPLDAFNPPNPPLEDATLAEVERRLGVKLPAAYVAIMRDLHNGGYVPSMLIRVDAPVSEDLAHALLDNGYATLGSLAGVTLTEEDWQRSILGSPKMIEEWGLPSGLVLIDGDGHSWIALDYREPGAEPRVVAIDSDSGGSIELAPTFDAFLERLVLFEDVFDEDGELRPGR
jgi:hypothetical protein